MNWTERFAAQVFHLEARDAPPITGRLACIKDGGFVQTAPGKFAANFSVLDYLRMPVARVKPGSGERESRPFFLGVQHWVQLGPVLGSFFGVKRCRINESVES